MFTTFIAQIMQHKITNCLVYLTHKCQNTDMIIYCTQAHIYTYAFPCIWIHLNGDNQNYEPEKNGYNCCRWNTHSASHQTDRIGWNQGWNWIRHNPHPPCTSSRIEPILEHSSTIGRHHWPVLRHHREHPICKAVLPSTIWIRWGSSTLRRSLVVRSRQNYVKQLL